MATCVLICAGSPAAIPREEQSASLVAARSEIEAQVLKQLVSIGSSASIERLGGVESHGVLQEGVRIEIGNIVGPWPRRRATVPLRYIVDDRVIKVANAWVELRDDRRVLTYGESSGGRTPASKLALEWRIVDMTCCSGTPLAGPGSLSGLRTKHAVRSGYPVLSSDFEAIPEVSARDKVDITLIRGSVRLVTRGTALSDAWTGQVVVVQLDETQSKVRARVVAVNEVKIDER